MMFKIKHMDIEVDDQKKTILIVIDYATEELVGTATLFHKNRDSASIVDVFVAEHYRGGGVGRRLVEECRCISMESGCETIGLVVSLENTEAKKFYRHLGFVSAYQYDDGSNLMVQVMKASDIENDQES